MTHYSAWGGTAYYGECEAYCERHAPEGSEPNVNDCESDTPEHCAICHVPLDTPLTPDGEEYVIEAVRDELRKGARAYSRTHSVYQGTYWEGSPHCAIVCEWINRVYKREAQGFLQRACEWMERKAKAIETEGAN